VPDDPATFIELDAAPFDERGAQPRARALHARFRAGERQTE